MVTCELRRDDGSQQPNCERDAADGNRAAGVSPACIVCQSVSVGSAADVMLLPPIPQLCDDIRC